MQERQKGTRRRMHQSAQEVGVLAEVCRGDLSVHVVIILQRLLSRRCSKTEVWGQMVQGRIVRRDPLWAEFSWHFRLLIINSVNI